MGSIVPAFRVHGGEIYAISRFLDALLAALASRRLESYSGASKTTGVEGSTYIAPRYWIVLVASFLIRLVYGFILGISHVPKIGPVIQSRNHYICPLVRYTVRLWICIFTGTNSTMKRVLTMLDCLIYGLSVH